MSADGIRHIIEEVAFRHGISLGEDDPVLMVYTINRLLMESSARIQQDALDRQLCGMEESVARIHDEAASRLEKGLREVSAGMRQMLLQETERLLHQQRRENQAILDRLVTHCNRGCWLAAASAVVSVLAFTGIILF